jgi:ADP-ribose pyrophosphatase YjhB (NUDIX family)
MTERFKYVGAGYLFLVRDGKILMQRRCNTGFMDGFYGVPAGHLEGNETAREGAAREFREEIGIEVDPEDLKVVHVMHRKAKDDERVDFFMTTERYEGEIRNLEPHKCDDLSWFSLESLPENTIDYVRVAIEAFLRNEPYSEFGWN